MKGWNHGMKYNLPIKPSPNLPTPESIAFYPSLCFFEGINYSLGRGTDKPFECIGKPGNTHGNYTFTPRNIIGIADNPPFMNKECRGYLLTDYAKNVLPINPSLNINWMIEMFQKDTMQDKFFNNFFNKLAGNNTLMLQIKKGTSEAEIRRSWEPELSKFKRIRKKYMLYTDFDGIVIRP
jgi:uncharacterized protein YbbC (DUF1343 family)